MKQEDLNHLLNSRVPTKAWDSTVSIAINKGESLYQHGTGTLLRIGDSYFIITAGHVIKQASENNRILCMAARKNGAFIQLHGTWICSANNQGFGDSDLFDVAVLRLEYQMVEKIEGKSFLGIIDIDTNSSLETGIFSLFGFPSLLASPGTIKNHKMILKPFQYTTYAYKGSTDNLDKFEGRYHFLLGARPDESTDIDGKPMKLFSQNSDNFEFPLGLRGVSGCSVWKIGDYERPVSSWEKARPKLVGVQTAIYNDSQIIKVTRWIAVSTLIYEAFPDLRPAMSLWYLS